MQTMTQHHIKCKVQDTKRMISHYTRISKTNTSKFVKTWIKEYTEEYKTLLTMVDDKSWIKNYGTLEYTVR